MLMEDKKSRQNSGSKKLGQNLCNILRAYNMKQADLAVALDIAPGVLSDYLHGVIMPAPDKFERLERFFGISREALLNGDFSDIGEAKTDNKAFAENIFILLPIFVSDKAKEDKYFSRAVEAQKDFYEIVRHNKQLTEQKENILLYEIFDCYEREDMNETAKELSTINCVSMFFLMAIVLNGEENISRLKNEGDVLPVDAYLECKNNSHFKHMIEEAAEKIDNINVFQDLVQDKEMDYYLNTLLSKIRSTGKRGDLLDYYIALQYLFGLENNSFSFAQNRGFGNDLMNKLVAIGNPYAKQFLDIMGSFS